MRRKVRFSRRSESDLTSIYDYVSQKSGTEIAYSYTLRIREYCLSLETFAERGAPWEGLSPGLRVIGFERRVSVAFRVTPDTVTIFRILYGGRDLNRALK